MSFNNLHNKSKIKDDNWKGRSCPLSCRSESYWLVSTHHIELCSKSVLSIYFNPIALRKTNIVYKFGLSECNNVNKWCL